MDLKEIAKKSLVDYIAGCGEHWRNIIMEIVAAGDELGQSKNDMEGLKTLTKMEKLIKEIGRNIDTLSDLHDMYMKGSLLEEVEKHFGKED